MRTTLKLETPSVDVGLNKWPRWVPQRRVPETVVPQTVGSRNGGSLNARVLEWAPVFKGGRPRSRVDACVPGSTSAFHGGRPRSRVDARVPRCTSAFQGGRPRSKVDARVPVYTPTLQGATFQGDFALGKNRKSGCGRQCRWRTCASTGRCDTKWHPSREGELRVRRPSARCDWGRP